MQLITDEKAPMGGRQQYREGKVLVLSFGWNEQQQRYLTDRGEDLGAAWPDAVRTAEALAKKRLEKRR
ncbi:MAG: hypothetical protein K0Q71_2131 [Thermomicrobiales bacterium]|jgi:hypothetical protein|nr:hypothetical protein [Thermomicrobiales bacterium]